MYIITVVGKEKEGAYSVIDEDGEQVLYIFMEEDDATRYSMQLEELDYPDVNPLSSDGTYTPMIWAAQAGKLNVVKYYIGAVQGD